MSVSVIAPDTDLLVSAECGTCELPFLTASPDRDEVAHLVGIHNGLHHAGRDEAVLILPDRDAVEDVDQDDDDADGL